jgi:hypothetical protein
MFVPGKLFQPSPMFAGNARSLPYYSGAPETFWLLPKVCHLRLKKSFTTLALGFLNKRVILSGHSSEFNVIKL